MVFVYRLINQSNTTDKEDFAGVEGKFDSLDIEEIQGIELFRAPPEEDVQLTQEQMAECINLLKEIKYMARIKKAPLDDLVGGAFVRLTITKKDDSVLQIEMYSPYIAIDNKWYKVNDQQRDKVEKINEFAYDVFIK